MDIRILTSTADLKAYDTFVRAHPQGSLWQSIEWKKYQESLGREVRIYGCGKMKEESGKYDATALVVIDKIMGGFSTWEIPRGPLWTVEADAVDLLKRIIDDAKKERCIELFFSPSITLPTNHYPLTTSSRHVQPQATRILDLTQSEEQILAQMHTKGRYNIGVAKKHGIDVAKGSIDDIDTFYDLLRSTGGRDGFKISQKSHYKRFLTDLRDSFILLGKHEGKAVAGLVGVVWPTSAPRSGATGGKNGTGIYYYGASSYEHRHLMAPYLIQWEAMRLCKAAGCASYDLLGISPEPAPKNDPWWGISDFKRKFGGTVISYPPEQSLVLRPTIKLALRLKRSLLG